MKNSVEEALIQCISIPSPNPPGNVDQVANWLKKWAKAIGASIEVQEVEPLKDNILLSLDFGSGPNLLFNTHMDVNNPSGQKWDMDPFEPKVKENKIFGLGACDAKGSLVSMMYALQNLTLNPNGLRGKITLTAVMGEESGGHGSLHLVNQGIEADGAIVGEPTNLDIAVAHKGTYMKKIRIKGVASHSAQPEKGVNAITYAARLILEIEKLNQKLQQNPHPFLGAANAAVTIIHGGTRQNTIPDFCELIFDRRLIPGETHEKADLELQKIVQELKFEDENFELDALETIVATIPSETATSERIVQIAVDSKEKALQSSYTPTGFRAGCDMSKLVSISKIPTIVLGPGSLEQAHAPNEFVEIEQLHQAVELYENIARSFLL